MHGEGATQENATWVPGQSSLGNANLRLLSRSIQSVQDTQGDQCVWRAVEWVGDGVNEAWVVPMRTVTFTLSDMRSHQRPLNGEVMASGLPSNRSTLAADLGRAYWGPWQKQGERRADTIAYGDMDHS